MKKENGIITDVTESDLNLLKTNPEEFWEGVSCIGEGAFYYLSLESIEIPDSVTRIEDGAFDYCDLLTTVKLPKQLKEIPEKAFYNCVALHTVQMPENLEEIGENAFANCGALSEVKIPKTVRQIGEGAFKGCINFKNIILPEGIEVIETLAFKGCGMEEITIPKSVAEIKYGAFSNCDNLKRINISKDSELVIESNAFENCENIQYLDIPEWTILKKDCFSGLNVQNTELTIGNVILGTLVSLNETGIDCKKINIREGVKHLKNNLFQDSSLLQEVNLPSTLKSIGSAAFADCYGLRSIKLPENLEIIENDAFNACETLTGIVIPDSVTTIKGGCFSTCCDLESVKLPKNLKELGYKAFMNCYQLNNVEIPLGITSIESETFKNCENLTNVTIPQSVIFIGPETFYGCTKLKNINLPESVTTIAKDCFCKSGITNIKIPDSVKNLGVGAFQFCRNLLEVELSNNLKEIPKEAFKHCNNLTTINIPASVEKIGSYAFGYCNKLSKIKVNRSVKIERDAFKSSSIKFVIITKDEIIFSKNTEKVAGAITVPYDFYELLNTSNMLDTFIENYDLKAFHNEMKPWQKQLDLTTEAKQLAFYKFAYALGCFSTEKLRDTNGKELEATKGQKRSSLLASMISLGALNFTEIEKLFGKIKFSELNDDVVKFLSNLNKKEYVNISLLKNLEEENAGISVKVISDFATAKAGRTTINPKNGMPQTISWEQAFINYYQARLYEGIDEENKDLAIVFKQKNIEQMEFDEADQIRRKAKKDGVPSHILGKPLKEFTLLETLEKTKNQTLEILKDDLNLAEELYAKQFTFEMLDKHDPHNAIIGLFTSCCATITSEAYGGDIARATMRSMCVQNLVVRNYNNEIVAKGTLYVNKKFGYIVINDFEINEQYKKDKTDAPGRYSSAPNSQMEINRELIFNALMRGINAFVEEYDKQNPDNPIKQVNVGMGYNRLKNQCEKYEKATNLLTVPEEYAFEDTKSEQNILYKRDESKIQNKNIEEDEIK